MAAPEEVLVAGVRPSAQLPHAAQRRQHRIQTLPGSGNRCVSCRVESAGRCVAVAAATHDPPAATAGQVVSWRGHLSCFLTSGVAQQHLRVATPGPADRPHQYQAPETHRRGDRTTLPDAEQADIRRLQSAVSNSKALNP